MGFYKIAIDEGNKKKYAYAIGVEENSVRITYCPICKKEKKIKSIFDTEVNSSITLSNDNYADFLWNYIILISENAIGILKNERISGYQLKSTHILSREELSESKKKELKKDGVKVDKIPISPPNYFRIYSDLSADYHEKSGIVLVESCQICGYRKYESPGKEYPDIEKDVLKKETLPETDLFNVSGAGLYCSERFVDIYKRHNLTGLIFKEIEIL